jgi:hypothetical protein
MTENQKLLERWAMAMVARNTVDAAQVWAQIVAAGVKSEEVAPLNRQAENEVTYWSQTGAKAKRYSEDDFEARFETSHYVALGAAYRLALVRLLAVEAQKVTA